MKMKSILLSAIVVLLAVAVGTTHAVPLFNGVDLSGWTYGSWAWEVENGVLRNTGVGDIGDWLRYETQLPSEEFSFEIRMRVVDHSNAYPRPRIYMVHEFYFGNEGFINQFEIYGSDLTNIQQVGNDSYDIGEWNVLRLEVDNQDQVSFYKNGILTHTATRIRSTSLNILIRPGDDWSAGHIEISSITYIPEPATLLLLALGTLALRKRKYYHF